jgi:hypothetical protein
MAALNRFNFAAAVVARTGGWRFRTRAEALASCPTDKTRQTPAMVTRCTSLLLAIFFAAHVGFFALGHVSAQRMPCCAPADAATAAHRDHCPPSGQTGGACCPDCPSLLPALLAEDATRQPAIARAQISTIPLVSWRAASRVEEPPVPPPRGG